VTHFPLDLFELHLKVMKAFPLILVAMTFFTSTQAFAQAGAEYTMGLAIGKSLAGQLGKTLPAKQERAVANFNFEVDPADKPAGPVDKPAAGPVTPAAPASTQP
jgi:hypothetical protein